MGCLLLLICFKLEMRQTFYLCCSKEINGQASCRLLPFLGSAHPRVFGVTHRAFFLVAFFAAGVFSFMFPSFSVFASCSYLQNSYLCIGFGWLFSPAAALNGIMLEWLLQRGFLSKSPCTVLVCH